MDELSDAFNNNQSGDPCNNSNINTCDNRVVTDDKAITELLTIQIQSDPSIRDIVWTSDGTLAIIKHKNGENLIIRELGHNLTSERMISVHDICHIPSKDYNTNQVIKCLLDELNNDHTNELYDGSCVKYNNKHLATIISKHTNGSYTIKVRDTHSLNHDSNIISGVHEYEIHAANPIKMKIHPNKWLTKNEFDVCYFLDEFADLYMDIFLKHSVTHLKYLLCLTPDDLQQMNIRIGDRICIAERINHFDENKWHNSSDERKQKYMQHMKKMDHSHHTTIESKAQRKYGRKRRGPPPRAPIKACSNAFMNDIKWQNELNLPGVLKVRHRVYEKCGWTEIELVDHEGGNDYIYVKDDQKESLMPKELENNVNFTEIWKDYKWKQQTTKLDITKTKVNDDDDDDMKHTFESFPVRTNTFPVELAKDVNIVEYNIEIKSVHNKRKLSWKHKNFNRILHKRRQQITESFDPYIIDRDVLFYFESSETKEDDDYKADDKIHRISDDEYCIQFQFISNASLESLASTFKSDTNTHAKSVRTQQRSKQVLQFILNEILYNCGLKLVRKAPIRGFFSANIDNPLCCIKPVYKHKRNNDIGVLRGINPKIYHTPNRLSVKISNANKFMRTQTVHALMENIKDKIQIERRLIGKEVMVLYSHQQITIHHINFAENENSTFGIGDTQISYADYALNKQYLDTVKAEKFGVILDQRGLTHLPQCLQMTLDGSKNVNMLRKEAAIYLSKNINAELDSIEQFVSFIVGKQYQGTDLLLKLIKITPNSIKTNAYALPTMKMKFKTGDTYKYCDEVSIARNWRSVQGVINGPHNYKTMKFLFIGTYSEELDTLTEFVDTYFTQRQFRWNDSALMQYSTLIAQDIYDTNSLMNIFKTQNIDGIIFILPDDHKGSLLKRQMHRICLELGIVTQFLSCANIHPSMRFKDKRNIIWGMMSDVVSKMGFCLYQIKPQVTATFSQIINESNTMILGLDVCHPTRIQSTKRPSVAVMTSMYGNIYQVNMEDQRSAVFFNANRQEICQYDTIRKMTVNVMTHQLLRDEISTLPHNILYIRDGVADSQIAEFCSKEMSAILYGIRTEIKQNELLQEKFEELWNWKPVLEVAIVQKRIIDRFAKIDTDTKEENDEAKVQITTHSPAFIMPWDVVSGEWFEFYLEIGLRTPSRVIFVRDELNLKKYPMDTASFLYGLHWISGTLIPFDNGPLNVASPIKVADHWANIWQELLQKQDQSLKDIAISEKLNAPKLITLDDMQ